MLAGQFDLVGFADDGAPVLQSVGNKPVLGTTADFHAYRLHADAAIVAIGNNALRQALSEKLMAAGFELATVIHPRAIVSPSAIIEPGSAIMAGAIVGTEAKLGRGAIVNCGAVVDHHAQVEDFGHLGVNACMAGGAQLGRGAWLQAGVALGYGANIPPGAVLTCAAASVQQK
jgi:sugar O-acyltransferase (sialic acid O-acetyltransferase NeuD family)